MSNYSPYRSTLALSLSAGALTSGTPISFTVPGGWGDVDRIITGEADNPGIVDGRFREDDRPFMVRYGLFCNFADGLVIQAVTPFMPRILLVLSDVAPVAPVPISHALVPALNTWIESGDFLAPVGTGVRTIRANLLGAAFLTDTIDSAFDTLDVTFQIIVQVEHTYPLEP